MIKIAEPETKHVDWILDELEKFSAFYQTRTPLFGDRAHVKAFITSLMNGHFVRLALRGEEPVGFIFAMLHDHPFNPNIKAMTELAWWVEEKSRGSSAGLLLFKELVDFGKCNVHVINFSLEAKSPVRDEFLLKRGFTLKERSFFLEV